MLVILMLAPGLPTSPFLESRLLPPARCYMLSLIIQILSTRNDISAVAPRTALELLENLILSSYPSLHATIALSNVHDIIRTEEREYVPCCCSVPFVTLI